MEKEKKKSGRHWRIVWKRGIEERRGSTHWRIRRNSLIEKGGKVHKSGKREIVARVLPGTLLVLFIFYFILVFPFTFHSRFSGCFQEVILADWGGH